MSVKSLLIDTIGELFAGNTPLFQGLAIHPHWNWSVRHPVSRISLGSGVLRSREARDRRIAELLRINREALGVTVHPGLDVADTARSASRSIKSTSSSAGSGARWSGLRREHLNLPEARSATIPSRPCQVCQSKNGLRRKGENLTHITKNML